MQLVAQERVISADARTAAPSISGRVNNIRNPDQQTSEHWEIPVTPHMRTARKAQSMRAIMSDRVDRHVSASPSRSKACETSKQSTRWAPRQNANVQSAPTSRQMPPGTFTEKPVPDGPDGFDEPRGSRRCRGRSLRASASYRSRRTYPVLSGEHPGAL